MRLVARRWFCVQCWCGSSGQSESSSNGCDSQATLRVSLFILPAKLLVAIAHDCRCVSDAGNSFFVPSGFTGYLATKLKLKHESYRAYLAFQESLAWIMVGPRNPHGHLQIAETFCFIGVVQGRRNVRDRFAAARRKPPFVRRARTLAASGHAFPARHVRKGRKGEREFQQIGRASCRERV